MLHEVGAYMYLLYTAWQSDLTATWQTMMTSCAVGLICRENNGARVARPSSQSFQSSRMVGELTREWF